MKPECKKDMLTMLSQANRRRTNTKSVQSTYVRNLVESNSYGKVDWWLLGSGRRGEDGELLCKG